VVGLGEMVYVMGGSTGYQILQSAERYDCKTNVWSLIAPMNIDRLSGSATELNGKVKPVKL
jgi:kelch-like protein 10